MVILCVLKNWLGDVIFSSPAIRTLRMNFPAARIVCLAPERCLDILRANPCVDEAILFDERREHRSLAAKWKLIRRLRSLKPDRVYLFHRSFTRALLMWCTGAKERIGYAANWRRILLTTAVPEPSEKLHAVDYGLQLLQKSGLRVTVDSTYEFHFDRMDLENVKQKVASAGMGSRRLVAIHPGANWPPKRWPADRFRELARAIVARFNVNVVVSGGPDDAALAAGIAANDESGRIVSLAGTMNLKELGALFSLCSLVISSDSGPLHIAGGVGANVLGIFGPTSPALTGPRGRGKNIVIHYVPPGESVPWYGKRFPETGWMEHISVEEIFRAIEREKLL